MTLLKKNMSKSESNILTELEVAELLSIKQQVSMLHKHSFQITADLSRRKRPPQTSGTI